LAGHPIGLAWRDACLSGLSGDTGDVVDRHYRLCATVFYHGSGADCVCAVATRSVRLTPTCCTLRCGFGQAGNVHMLRHSLRRISWRMGLSAMPTWHVGHHHPSATLQTARTAPPGGRAAPLSGRRGWGFGAAGHLPPPRRLAPVGDIAFQNKAAIYAFSLTANLQPKISGFLCDSEF
jgi:hypothetical protein